MNERQIWMAIVAKAPLEDLETKWSSLTARRAIPNWTWIRPPEIGLIMIRSCAERQGQPFHLGEIPIARCGVQIQPDSAGDPVMGFGYVAGRSKRHAALAALVDGLMQLSDWHDPVWDEVLEPLQIEAADRKAQHQRQTAATQVNFVTMRRGEG